MRSIVIQVTGLADVPSPELGDKTPLEVAETPTLDELASNGILGLTRTVPEDGPATVNVATAAILGVDPAGCVLGPGAAVAFGLDVTVPPGARAVCLDLCAVAEQEGSGPAVVETRFPGLEYEDGAALAAALDEALTGTGARVHRGVGARHLLVVTDEALVAFAHPSDAALGRSLAEVLPADPAGTALRTLMSRARAALWEHPVCTRLRNQGLIAPTDVWPWGAAEVHALPAFAARFGTRAAAVAVAPVPRGVARAGGLAVEPALDGALPSLAARAERALALTAEYEFVLLHVETVDEAGGRGDATARVGALARVDAEVLAPIVAGLRAAGDDWRLAVMADVTSSCVARRDTTDPVLFVVASGRDTGRPGAVRRRFSERHAREQGIFLGEAHTLLERLLRR